MACAIETEGKIGYRYGQDGRDEETMDYLEFIRIINHLKLRFVAEKPPPSRVFEQVVLMAAEEPQEYF